jgi:hypothetical protein
MPVTAIRLTRSRDAAGEREQLAIRNVAQDPPPAENRRRRATPPSPHSAAPSADSTCMNMHDHPVPQTTALAAYRAEMATR